MTPNIFLFIALAALACTIASAVGKLPIWVAVLLLCLLELLRFLPNG